MTGALRVGVLGAGTVGREVVRAFLERSADLRADGGVALELAGVAVRDVARAAASGIPADLLSDAPAHLVADPRIDVLVELIGGEEPARTLVAAALAAGKAVVTANKHVLAHHGPQLEAAARASRAPLRFEAAVGGGIPVLRPLAADLASNRVTRIRGVVNGTTNAILSGMARDARSYDEALADAQAKGYAEADPTADVAGLDAANKLAILARLGFGEWLDPDAIDRRPATVRGTAGPGITGVGAADVAAASAHGLALKLVADASATPRDEATGLPAVTASVLPTAVPLADPLGRTDGVTNRFEIRAEPLGSVAFVGPGAGGAATASAVLGDLLAIARGEGSTWAGLAPPRRGDEGIRPVEPAERDPGRGWLVAVPRSFEACRLPSGPDISVDVATTPDALAVHVRGIGLADLRRALAARLPAEADPAIFPVDEPGDAR